MDVRWKRGLLVLGSPIWLSLGLAAAAVLLALYISMWSVFVTLLCCGVGAIVAGIGLACMESGPSGLATVAAGLVCTGLSAFAFLGCKAATGGFLARTKRLLLRKANVAGIRKKKINHSLRVAGLLVLAGSLLFVGVMTMLKWDFTKLQTVTYETNRHEITQPYQNIAILADTAVVEVVPSEDGTHLVVCHEQNKVKHKVSVRDGTLVVEREDTRKWYEHLAIDFGTSKITVCIPAGEYGAISVNTSTGDVRVEQMTTESLGLSVSTGSIAVSNVSCLGDIHLRTSTGNNRLTDVTCQNLFAKASTGDITLSGVVAQGLFDIETGTGKVRFDHADAAEISVQTSTGEVTGSLRTGKIFMAQTSTGRVVVPKTTTGGKCDITTGTGDIELSVAEN